MAKRQKKKLKKNKKIKEHLTKIKKKRKKEKKKRSATEKMLHNYMSHFLCLLFHVVQASEHVFKIIWAQLPFV